MGVHPEPAHRADDVCCLAPCETFDTTGGSDRSATEPSRNSFSSAKCRGAARLVVAAVAAGGLLLISGQRDGALQAPAVAHDRLDESALSASATGGGSMTERVAAWHGVPLMEEQPATSALIADTLSALPRPAGSNDGVVQFGEARVPRAVVAPIVRASAETGVDPAYMMALADKESRFDVEARNPASSAEGLFQFVTATWLEMIRDFGARHGLAAETASVSGRGGALTIANPAARARVLGLRKDPYVAALMAAELAKRDRSRVESRIGRALRTSELYVAHFLGTASAGRFFTLSSDKPDEVAQKVFRNAARANRSLFVSGGAQKRGGKGHGRGLTVAELHERLDGMIDRRISRYEGVAALVQEAPSRVVLAEAGTP